MDNGQSKVPPEINLNIVQQQEDEYGVTVRDLLRALARRKWTILFVTFIALIIGIATSFVYTFLIRKEADYVSAMLSYGYKGVEEGLDPMGRPLDVNKIKAPAVIEPALQELGFYDLGISVEDVRENVYIDVIVPDDVVNRMMMIETIAEKDITQLERLLDIQYYPTQFFVNIGHLGNLEKLSGVQMENLLDAVLSSYREYFIQEYSDRSIFSVINNDFDQTKYDYSEVVEILDNMLDNMISYCSIKRQEAPEFRSPQTQMSFADIITNLEIIQNTDLGRISSRVYTYNMSRDRNQLITRYLYSLNSLRGDLYVALQNAAAANTAAADYVKDPAVIVGGANGEPFEVTQSSSVYDTFLQDALSSTMRANQIRERIAFTEDRLLSMGVPIPPGTAPEDPENPEDPEPVNPPVTAQATQADIDYVERIIPDIISTMQNYADITLRTVEDYLVMDAFADATRVVLPAHYSSESRLKLALLITAAVTAAGLVLAVLSFIFKTAFNAEHGRA